MFYISLPTFHHSYYSSLFAEQTLDGVGTASDDLALKKEEEKQQMKAEKKKFVNLPADGGDEIAVRFFFVAKENSAVAQNLNRVRSTDSHSATT